MDNIFQNYASFISEQKTFFESNLSKDFHHNWDNDAWNIGTYGTGWLKGSGKGILTFDNISDRMKGIKSKIIINSKEYKDFMKSIIVAIYRKKQSISTTVAVANLIILKRWYNSLLELTDRKHPIYLNTEVIHHAMDLYTISSKNNDSNVADTLGRCVSLQNLINRYAFCLTPLNFQNSTTYSNNSNYTRKAKELQNLKEQDFIDDKNIEDKQKLITIDTFLNIVNLIHKCEDRGERILLNLVILLIITGFRSIEAINLRKDSLIRREIEDLDTKNRLINKGLRPYFLGIKYIGAKGAGERIHWLEPSSVPLVETIFDTVKDLTQPLREHLIYLRVNKFSSYLPKEIELINSDFVELDDIDRFIIGTKSDNRGRGGRRDKVRKTLRNARLISIKKDRQEFFSKANLNEFVAQSFIDDQNQTTNLCTVVWNTNQKNNKIPYEDLLFIHARGSTNIRRTLVYKSTPIPFDNKIINDFLGASKSVSIFQKYDLKESNSDYTRLTSHIPRHNINTFLAIAEIADHLQAMLMGRIDITQNQHYKHLAIEHLKTGASVLPYTIQEDRTINDELSELTPIEVIKRIGSIHLSQNLDTELNLKANLHTFDNKYEKSNFIKMSFQEDLFEDLKAAFDDIENDEGSSAAEEMIFRHTNLHPLKLGSCTYDVGLWSCPYGVKCQSGESCSHFTLTGRADEIYKIIALKNKLERLLIEAEEIVLLNPERKGVLKKVSNQLDHVIHLEKVTKKSLSNKNTINIYAGTNNKIESRHISTFDPCRQIRTVKLGRF